MLARPVFNAFGGAQRMYSRDTQSTLHACKLCYFLCHRDMAISVVFLAQAKVNFMTDALGPAYGRMKKKASAGGRW